MKRRYKPESGQIEKGNEVGRVDVLMCRCLELATNALDARLGTSGTWERVGDVVKLVVDEHVPKKPVPIPKEAQVLAKLMGF